MALKTSVEIARTMNGTISVRFTPSNVSSVNINLTVNVDDVNTNR
jgi:hypothetical protein